METDRAIRLVLFASLILLIQATVPPAMAHSGDHPGQNGGEEEAQGIGTPLTPDRDFAEQRNPHMDGPRLVWQERTTGQDDSWDIMMANMSQEEISVVPLTEADHEDVEPIVHEDRIAWTRIPADDTNNRNLAVLDLSTGRIHHVPDEGAELHPTFAGNGSLYYVSGDKLKGYDIETGAVFDPAGDVTVNGEPSAYEHWVVWGEGGSKVKIHILDTRTGEVTEVPGLYNVVDGPTMGPAGVAWIARHGGEFSRGVYTTLYNMTTNLQKFRTHVYPHGNVDSCDAGVVWDQPGTSTTDRSAVAFWDRYVDGIQLFGKDAFSGTCGADHLVYEKNVQGDADSGQGTRQLRFVDLTGYRIFRDAEIVIDPEDDRRILRGEDILEGVARSVDPREPIVQVYATINGGRYHAVEQTRTEDGVRWSAPVNPDLLEPGRHRLSVLAEDRLGRTTTESFTFYTETPYRVDPTTDGDPFVPRQGDSPFPFSVLNHYQDYAPFYNTVALGVLVIAGIVWYGYRRYTDTPTGTPEYVPPDEA